MVTYHSEQKRADYYPPLLGNGDIAMGVDSEGAMNYSAEMLTVAYNPTVFREARRLAAGHNNASLIPHANFIFCQGSEIKNFEQSLDAKSGIITGICDYSDGDRIASESFIHQDKNIYALKKTFLAAPDTDKEYSFKITTIPHPYEEFAPFMSHVCTSEDGVLYFDFKFIGQKIFTGRMAFLLDRDYTVEEAGADGAVIKFNAKCGDTVHFYYCLEDDYFDKDYAQTLRAWVGEIRERGYEALKEDTVKCLQEYHALGYVNTGDKELDTIYATCLYGLHCYVTKHYSIPVGICNYWESKFFAFDEYYSMLGLLGANRLNYAKKVPDFRREVCLKKAIFKHTARTEGPAHFMWETSEYGDELSPQGHWRDHVFHMALVAIGAFEYYEFSNDLDSLKQNYPMIRACAEFYTKHMIYRDGDRVYLGKCTDLERIGYSVESAFMSTCGVIKTLDVLVQAADILGIDKEYRDECEKLAEELRAGLPVEDGHYVPYPNCPQKSVAVYAGKFPYNALDSDDEKLIAAWEDFEENGGAFGNMYAVGSKLSSWYACWKAEAYARAHDAKKAYRALRQSFESVGAFSEMFEINEDKTRYRPWFTTTQGIYLSTVNEMLLQSDAENIYLLPAFPEWKDLSFRLSAKGGRIVELCVKDGKIETLNITDRNGNPDNSAVVWYRGEKIEK